MKTMATASMPSRWRCSIAGLMAARSSTLSTAPSARTRSSTSIDALVKLLGQDDLLGEDIGPRLVGDAQRVAKTLGDEQQHAVALALEQRVGGDGRAHLDVADAARPGSGAPGATPSNSRMPWMAASR